MDPGTDVDNILKTLGRFGKYQIIQMALLTLFVLQNSFHLVSAVYIGKYDNKYNYNDPC